jgi:hypothetical protein
MSHIQSTTGYTLSRQSHPLIVLDDDDETETAQQNLPHISPTPPHIAKPYLLLTEIFDKFALLFTSLSQQQQPINNDSRYLINAFEYWHRDCILAITKNRPRAIRERNNLDIQFATTIAAIQYHHSIFLNGTTRQTADIAQYLSCTFSSPPKLFFDILRLMVEFYQRVPSSNRRAIRVNLVTQTTVLSIFTSTLASITHANCSTDVYLSDYYTQLSKINQAIQLSHNILHPASLIPSIYYHKP